MPGASSYPVNDMGLCGLEKAWIILVFLEEKPPRL